MLEVDYTQQGGWGAPKILPYGPFKIPIGATALHYGISCYEGLNVLKNTETGGFQAFRQEDHLRQFYLSSNHLDMPLFDQSELFNCVKQLVKIDADWWPAFEDFNSQYYVRFCHISTDPVLGVRTPVATKLYAILSPTVLRQKNLQVKCSDGVYKNWPLGHG